MTRVYLSIGANLGDREASLREAVRRLSALGTVALSSSIRETEPWGGVQQPMFLNMAVALDTDLTPNDLLASVKEIERNMGRVPGPRSGPRLIAIDILLYGDTRVQTDVLRIPHPHMLERDFVMVPLREIAPQAAEAARALLEETDHADVSLRSDRP